MPSSSLNRRAPSTRRFLAVVAALFSIPLSCIPVIAGTITYTWIEDDGQQIAGQLLVNSSAQAAGQITPADIISFSWTGKFETYNTIPPLSPDPLPISTLDAGFAATSAHLGPVLGVTHRLASVDTNVNYQALNSQFWLEGQQDQFFAGAGHWSVDGATVVPEPTTMTIYTAFAGIIGTIMLWRCFRRQQPVSAVS